MNIVKVWGPDADGQHWGEDDADEVHALTVQAFDTALHMGALHTGGENRPAAASHATSSGS